MEPRRYERITDVNFLSGRKGWVIAADACIILLLIAYVVGFTVELRQTSTDNDVQRVVDTIESLQRRSVIYPAESTGIGAITPDGISARRRKCSTGYPS